MKKAYRIFLFTIIFFISHPLFHYSLVFSDESAIILHEGAWFDVVERAQTDKYYKYGLYASRILAVKHPEIYLQADILFVETVNDKILLTLTDERSFAFDIRPMTFSLNKLNFSHYTTITLTQSYPSEAPIFNYLDRRMLSPAATLRRKSRLEIVEQNKIKQIELASLYYIKERQKARFNDLYIVYCDNEDTYLWSNNNLISMKTLTLHKERISGNPILIFNEKYVWYPLMKRDDTRHSRLLKGLVERYKTDIQEPSLSEVEKKLIRELLDLTKVKGTQYKMAILSATRLSSFYGFKRSLVMNKNILKQWHEIFPNLTKMQIQSTIPPHSLGGIDDIILEEITKRANYLSPLTSYIAALAKAKGKFSPHLIANKYKELGFQWNCLWTLGLEQVTIDESFFSVGGTCEVQANNLALICYLTGIDNIIIQGYEIGKMTHQIVYLPEYDQIFTNGWLINSQGTILHFPRAIFMISDKDNWAIIVKNSYVGTLAPSKAIERLEFLKAKHGDDIKGIVSNNEVCEISFEELIGFLKTIDKNWKPIELP